MSLKIEVDPAGDVTHLRVAGEITVKTYRQLTETIEALADRTSPPARVRLDLALVDYVDSVGLGSLIKIFTALKRSGIGLIIANPARSIRDSMALTKLDQLLTLE